MGSVHVSVEAEIRTRSVTTEQVSRMSRDADDSNGRDSLVFSDGTWRVAYFT